MPYVNAFKECSPQVSLGLLGVITEVTFQCEAAFNLEQTLLLSSLDDCLDNMTAHVHSAQHVKMWIEFYSEQCVVYQVNRSKEAPRDQPNFTIFSIRVGKLQQHSCPEAVVCMVMYCQLARWIWCGMLESLMLASLCMLCCECMLVCIFLCLQATPTLPSFPVDPDL